MEMIAGRLEETLKELQKTCKQFEQVLEKEFKVLQQPDPNAVVDVVAEKHAIMNFLFEKESVLRALLNATMTEPLGKLLEETLKTFKDFQFRTKLESLVGELLDSIAKCKLQNQMNGTIVRRTLEFNQKILHALLQPTASEKELEMYNEKGQIG